MSPHISLATLAKLPGRRCIVTPMVTRLTWTAVRRPYLLRLLPTSTLNCSPDGEGPREHTPHLPGPDPHPWSYLAPSVHFYTTVSPHNVQSNQTFLFICCSSSLTKAARAVGRGLYLLTYTGLFQLHDRKMRLWKLQTVSR